MTVTEILMPIIDLYPLNKQVVLAQFVIGMPIRSQIVISYNN